MNKLFFASTVTLGVLSSFIFFLVMLVLLYTDAINIWLAIALTIIINFIMWLIGPFFTDLINKWFYNTKYLTKAEVETQYPDVAQLLTQISTEYKFPFPKVGIIADNNPTAFTYGSGRYNARIVLTEGVFHFLSPQEVRAVLAHELGHVVHRDFIVMMIASTMVQIIYEIYAVLIRVKGRKSGSIKLIAILAYVLYLVGTYVLYYLSRTRETLADEFSACKTSPQDLANGLIKIAYGIVAAEDDSHATRLLQSTRHLGIVDVKNAKHVGVTSYITHNDPNAIAEVMVFDKVSWWAKWLELNSTHPLTGKRIIRLSAISKKIGQPFSFDIEGAIARLTIDHGRLKREFIIGFAFQSAPVIGVLLSLFFASPLMIAVGLCLGIIISVLYKFPQEKAVQTTILEEMRNPYASPVRGKAVLLTGKVIGRGVPGFVLSEDMMYQDKTGLTFLDFNSVFGFLGDWFFAVTKIKKLYNVESTAEGWYFRGMGSIVALRYIKTQTETVTSHPMLWSIVIPAAIVFGMYFLFFVYPNIR